MHVTRYVVVLSMGGVLLLSMSEGCTRFRRYRYQTVDAPSSRVYRAGEEEVRVAINTESKVYGGSILTSFC